MEENKVIGNVSSINGENVLGIKADSSPFASSFYFNEFYDEKEVKKFIKNVERLVRTSKEYKTYISLLRSNIFALNHDSILGNITTADVDMEFHHYPLSLYDIIEVIITYNSLHEKPFTSFSIAKQVMEEHYKHRIGLVPLTETMHQLAHSGNIFLSDQQVFGDYKSFIKEYEDGVSNEILEKIKTMEEYSSNNVPSDFKGLL